MNGSRVIQEKRILGRSSIVTDGIIPGAIGGVIGGLVFGGVMQDLGQLPSVASLVRLESAIAGYLVHIAIALIVGVHHHPLRAARRRRGGHADSLQSRWPAPAPVVATR